LASPGKSGRNRGGLETSWLKKHESGEKPGRLARIDPIQAISSLALKMLISSYAWFPAFTSRETYTTPWGDLLF
jgi:hypothetical protein